MKMRMVLALVLALGVDACTGTPKSPPAPVFQIADIMPDKTDSTLSVSQTGDAAWIDVNSARGIGSARVVLTAGDVPNRIFLRVHLKGLELLKFTYKDVEIQISVPSRGEPIPSGYIRRTGSPEQPLSPTDENWMPVEIVGASGAIPLSDGYFQIELPRAFHTSGAREFSLEWIDFFR